MFLKQTLGEFLGENPGVERPFLIVRSDRVSDTLVNAKELPGRSHYSLIGGESSEEVADTMRWSGPPSTPPARLPERSARLIHRAAEKVNSRKVGFRCMGFSGTQWVSVLLSNEGDSLSGRA